jgi:hypothetical protein
MNYFEKIKEIKNNFEENLEKTNYKSFLATKEILYSFKEIFNPKNIAIVALFSTSGAYALDSPELINKSFQDSVKIQSLYYNEQLPEYFSNKAIIEQNKKDIILKNEFWKNNVVTLVFEEADDNLLNNELDKEITQSFSEEKGIISKHQEAVYIKRYSTNEITEDHYNKFVNTTNTYPNFMKNEASNVSVAIKEHIPDNYKHLVEEFITYHEMAHSSYEQLISQHKKFTELNFDLTSAVSFESHSDLSSLILTSKNNNLSFEEFAEFSKGLANFRSQRVFTHNDVAHNSSGVLLDFINNKNSKEIYETIHNDKISAFSAYYIEQLSKIDSKIFFKKVNDLGVKTDIDSILDNINIIKDKTLKNEKDFDLIQLIYHNSIQEVMIKRDPHLKEIVDDIVEGKGNYSSYDILEVINKNIKNMDEKEKIIYAATINKNMKNLTHSDFYNMFNAVAGNKFTQYYTSSYLEDDFSKNKLEIKNAIKI